MISLPDAPWIQDAHRNGYPVSDRYDWEDEDEESEEDP